MRFASNIRPVLGQSRATQRPLGHNLLDRLVEWWPLAEQSSTRLGVHAGLHLTDNNTVTGADGVGSLASQFTAASSEYLSRASQAALQTGDISFTYAAWVFPDSLTALRVVMGKDGSSSGQRENLLYIATAGQLAFLICRPTDDPRQAATAAGAVATSQWSFVVGWHDAAGDTVNCEVNANGTIATTATGGAAQSASSAQFEIGRRVYGGSPIPFDGRIQRVGFWKRILSADERAWLYNGGRGRDYPFL